LLEAAEAIPNLRRKNQMGQDKLYSGSPLAP
jgi:hypothetical protein